MRKYKLNPHQQGFNPPDEEKQQGITDVKNPQTLMIDSNDPCVNSFEIGAARLLRLRQVNSSLDFSRSSDA